MCKGRELRKGELRDGGTLITRSKAQKQLKHNQPTKKTLQKHKHTTKHKPQRHMESLSILHNVTTDHNCSSFFKDIKLHLSARF